MPASQCDVLALHFTPYITLQSSESPTMNSAVRCAGPRSYDVVLTRSKHMNWLVVNTRSWLPFEVPGGAWGSVIASIVLTILLTIFVRAARTAGEERRRTREQVRQLKTNPKLARELARTKAAADAIWTAEAKTQADRYNLARAAGIALVGLASRRPTASAFATNIAAVAKWAGQSLRVDVLDELELLRNDPTDQDRRAQMVDSIADTLRETAKDKAIEEALWMNVGYYCSKLVGYPGDVDVSQTKTMLENAAAQLDIESDMERFLATLKEIPMAK